MKTKDIKKLKQYFSVATTYRSTPLIPKKLTQLTFKPESTDIRYNQADLK